MKMETVMKFPVPSAALCSALGLALAAGGSAAHAQTIITPAVVNQPVVAVPTTTVQTTETIRTVRPAPRYARRQVVTTRTVTRQVVPSATVVARTMPAVPQPLYDEVAPVPDATAAEPLYDTARPLYDEVATPVAATIAPVLGEQPYTYRYVYEPDRILVIDPTTGVAVQSIPR
jgi:hypothetical protein